MGTKPNIRQFFVLKKIYLIAAGLAVVFLIVTNLILVKRVSDAETAVELRDSIIREAGSRSSSLEVKYLKSCFSGLLLNEDIKAFNAELVAADQRKYTLDQALGKGPVLILRYSELNCADCVVFALRKIAEIAEKYKVTPVIISEYSDMHSFKDAVANFGRDRFLFYHVEKFSDVDRKGVPYYCLLMPDRTVHAVFIPDKLHPQITDFYFENVVKRFFSNTDND